MWEKIQNGVSINGYLLFTKTIRAGNRCHDVGYLLVNVENLILPIQDTTKGKISVITGGFIFVYSAFTFIVQVGAVCFVVFLILENFQISLRSHRANNST
jgi:hypothetical protein